MRDLVFVKYYDKASTVLAADQVSEALRARGLESHAIYPDAIGEFHDAIMVFIKKAKLHHLWQARRQRNRTVLDLCDTPVFKRRIKNLMLLDGLICKNRRQLEDFGRRGRPDTVIYHQWDPRYRQHQAGEERLKVGYLGDRRSLLLWGDLPEVELIDSDYFETALRFNCHLSVRQPGRDALYKPGGKVSTAAGCGAVLITTPDESSLEMLGSDYPFYTGHTLEEVQKALGRAHEAIGGPAWQAARQRLSEVRDRTRLDRIADDYLDYFRRLQ